ncbi:MAG: hypothetical protein AB7G65_11035 [Thermoleophilia bacterium]
MEPGQGGVPGARRPVREYQRRMRRLSLRFDELNRIRRMVDVSRADGRRARSHTPGAR